MQLWKMITGDVKLTNMTPLLLILMNVIRADGDEIIALKVYV